MVIMNNAVTYMDKKKGYVIKPFGMSFGCTIDIGFDGIITMSSNQKIRLNAMELADIHMMIQQGLAVMQKYNANNGKGIAEPKETMIKPVVGGIYRRKNGNVFIHLGKGNLWCDNDFDRPYVRDESDIIYFETRYEKFESIELLQNRLEISLRESEICGLDKRKTLPRDCIRTVGKLNLPQQFYLDIYVKGKKDIYSQSRIERVME